MSQLAEHNLSHFHYSPLITRGSAAREQLLTLLLLSTHHQWVSWQSTAGQTSVTLHSSPVDQLAEYSWSHFCYSSIITRGSVRKAQLVTLLLLSTHHPWISWQSTACHNSVALLSSPEDQLAEYSWSHFCYSPLFNVDELAEHSWSHFCYSPVITRVSAGRAQWSHFCYSPLIISGSAGRAQLVTLLLLSTHHQWISWQSTAGHTAVTLQSSPVCQLAEHTGHTSVTLHSTPVCQLAENSWSHFCYFPFITHGSAGKAQLVTVLLHSTHHPWISWQITAGHTSVTLHSSPVDELAEYSWPHFCYSLINTRGSAGKAQLVTLLLLYTHHPWISWQSRVGHTSVTLHSSPVDQLAE